MDRLGVAVLLLSAIAGLSVIVVFGLMKLSARWFDPRIGLAFGTAFSVFVGRLVVSHGQYCAEPPEIILPGPGEEGEGLARFNCDAPWGIVDRAFIYLVGPIWLVASVVATIVAWRNSSRVAAP